MDTFTNGIYLGDIRAATVINLSVFCWYIQRYSVIAKISCALK